MAQNLSSAEKSLAVQGQGLAKIDEESCGSNRLNYGFVKGYPGLTYSQIFSERPLKRSVQ